MLFNNKHRADRFLMVPVALFVAFTAGPINVMAQGAKATRPIPPADPTQSEVHVAPVVVDGTTLFYVRGVMAFPAEKRAGDIAKRIKAVAAERSFDPQLLRMEESPLGTQILAGTQVIMTVIEPDARMEGIERTVLAHACTARIKAAIEAYRYDREPRVLAQKALYMILATVLLLAGLWSGHRLRRRLRSIFDQRFKDKVRGVHIQSLYFLHTEQLWRVLTGTVSFLWVIVSLVAVYIYLHIVLFLLPWTRGMANSLLEVVLNPLRTLSSGLLVVIPDIVFLAILGMVTWYLLKVVRLFFDGIEKGAVTFSGFDPEWARPTYRMVRVVIIAFALVVAYPYIPGSGSAAFKGISLFIGVIFSLGSTSLIGNLIAGYSMVYRHTFKLGDWVKIGDHMGSVDQTGLMVTVLRTPKNELVIVPNSMIINGEVVNYSTLAKKQGLVLHTTVGIGYETPWRQVEAMLMAAAARTQGVLREPKPFVLHKALGDFAVVYEVNVFCDQPADMLHLYTALHQNILDVFNEYGVQIMTPAYVADPARSKVVPIDQWYAAPASRQDSGEVCNTKEVAANSAIESPPIKGAA